MRKHKAALHLTFYEDSQTVTAYVEAENVAGRWTLLSEDTWRLPSGVSVQFDALMAWLEARMDGGSSSTHSTS